MADERLAKLLSTIDGKTWAQEFCRVTGFTDEAWALAWFANAIMAGFDEADRRADTRTREFIGYLSAEIPELRGVEVPRLGEAWDRFASRAPRLAPTDHALDALARRVHAANEKWWRDLTTGERIDRNVGELLMLCVTELAEALEGHRKGLPDDKLPHRSMFEVEIADCLIRLFDIAGGLGLDLGGAFEEKMQYNAQRVDHTREHRLAAGGKRY